MKVSLVNTGHFKRYFWSFWSYFGAVLDQWIFLEQFQNKIKLITAEINGTFRMGISNFQND